jgi:sulfatase modifying factor 1
MSNKSISIEITQLVTMPCKIRYNVNLDIPKQKDPKEYIQQLSTKKLKTLLNTECITDFEMTTQPDFNEGLLKVEKILDESQSAEDEDASICQECDFPMEDCICPSCEKCKMIITLCECECECDHAIHSNPIDQRSVKDVGFNMIFCPSGSFDMGLDIRDHLSQTPKHQVHFSNGFWIAETQVTQALWQAVMGWNYSDHQSSQKLPVENVTWFDCIQFCNLLSKLEGFQPCFKLQKIQKDHLNIISANVEWLKNANGYRLPTEAEWEYAAKAGMDLIYSGSNHLGKVGWFYRNTLNTREVKSKKANAWGLYDMTGNVDEWCMDQYDDTAYQHKNRPIENPVVWQNKDCSRVLRGGACWYGAERCRVSERHHNEAWFATNLQGFRLARSIDALPSPIIDQ